MIERLAKRPTSSGWQHIDDYADEARFIRQITEVLFESLYLDKRNKPYNDAIRRLMLEHPHEALFLGCGRGVAVKFRNFKKDKKGKLVYCEAYIADK